MKGIGKKGFAVVNAILATVILVLYFILSTPMAKTAMSELYASPVYRGHAKGVIALECAVSWNAKALPEILDILKKEDIRITFFVSGEWAQANEPLLARMVQEGHEIGTMGYWPLLDGDAKSVQADLEKSLAVINDATGVQPSLYYSGGRKTRVSADVAGRLKLKHVLCTVDLLSGRGSAEDILMRALDKPFDGSIILMQPTAMAADALSAWINGLRQMGYTVGTVSQALDENNEKGNIV